MLDVYDRDRAAALVKEGRAMIAALKSETGLIAVQVSRVRYDPEEDDAPPPRPKTALAPAMQRKTNRKPFWKFWR